MAPDAENRCETYVTEALLITPSSPEALQTLASIRISQLRPSDACAALSRSYNLWKDLESDDPNIPAYPTRLSFTRLLVECEMYDEAMDVLERLQEEDDQVVDLWYIGGWCLFLIGEKLKKAGGNGNVVNGNGKANFKIRDATVNGDDENDEDDWRDVWQASREWLQNCEKVFIGLWGRVFGGIYQDCIN